MISIAVVYATVPKKAACVTHINPEYPTTRFRLTPRIDHMEMSMRR